MPAQLPLYTVCSTTSKCHLLNGPCCHIPSGRKCDLDCARKWQKTHERRLVGRLWPRHVARPLASVYFLTLRLVPCGRRRSCMCLRSVESATNLHSGLPDVLVLRLRRAAARQCLILTLADQPEQHSLPPGSTSWSLVAPTARFVRTTQFPATTCSPRHRSGWAHAVRTLALPVVQCIELLRRALACDRHGWWTLC